MKPCLLSIVVSLVICQVFAQSSYDAALVIDNFNALTSPLILRVPQSGQSIHANTSTEDISILGGERNLVLYVETGQPSEIMTTAVSNGTWTTNSELCSGYVSIVYSGSKQGSSGGHPGLGCVDLTQGGKADSFIVETTSERATDFKFFVYTNDNENGVFKIGVEPSGDPQVNYIPFSSFDGNMDFTCINKIILIGVVPTSSKFAMSTLVVGKSRSSLNHCNSNADCAWKTLEEPNICSAAVCHNHECIITANTELIQCCNVKTDCVYHECHIASCSDFVCNYRFLTECDTHSTEESSYSPNVAVITLSVLFGCAALIILLVVITVAVYIWWNKRTNQDSEFSYGILDDL